MSTMIKFVLTGVLLALLLIPGIDITLAIPVIAALGYIWGFAPTTQ